MKEKLRNLFDEMKVRSRYKSMNAIINMIEPLINQEVEKRIKERIKNLPRYDIAEYDDGMCRHMDGDWLNFEEVRSSLSQKEGGAK